MADLADQGAGVRDGVEEVGVVAVVGLQGGDDAAVRPDFAAELEELAHLPARAAAVEAVRDPARPAAAVPDHLDADGLHAVEQPGDELAQALQVAVRPDHHETASLRIADEAAYGLDRQAGSAESAGGAGGILRLEADPRRVPLGVVVAPLEG